MVNIFKRDLPNGAIKRIENPQHNSEFFFSSKVSEKLHKLNVQGEVSLSVLFGIISVEGSAAYLNEKKNSSHDVQCSFVQKIRTISERVNLFDEELKACFGSDFGKGTSATHVVVGIEWGANATVTLTHASSKDVEKKEVEGRLKLALKKFSVGGEGKEPSANSSDNLFEELHMKVHADIMPNHEGAPRNVNEALEFIYNMPKRVADTNGGMGRQLEFHLLPISVLAELIQFFTNLNHIIHTIEIGEVKKFEQVFDQIDEYQEKLNDLLIVMNANKAILTKAVQDKVHDYRNDFEATVATFKADLAKKLCEVRGGEAELPELAYMRLEFQKHSTASPTKMPNAKCVPLELPCPKATPRGHCAKEKHEWICVNCHTIVEYNNNKIYCQCGYEHMQHFRYKCNHEMHGDGHIAFELDELQNLVNKIRPYEEINIVVLGETGVGKSTWINAIANYISHESIDTALEGELINLIPTKFQLTIKNGENLRRVEVKVGESENESFHENQSSTQIPRSYVFTNNQKLYRIIDTPGIGDTRGIEQDKQNIQSILSFLAQYDEIHAICILMMPNQSRLTPTFEFCFKELIMQFHRSAAQNIVFCFTNTSGSNFCVGETHGPLESLTNAIKSVQRVDIPLTSHTMYAFDNMAYRYLCTKIQENFLFPPDLEDLYRQSFIVSRKETLRLFEYVKDLPPHNAKDSLSLNYARKVIIGLTGPLTMISSAVGQTLEKIKEREKEIEEHKNNEQELLKILKRKIPITRYKMTKEDTVFCKTCSVQKSYYGEQRTPYYEADPTVMDKNPFKIWT
uniref:G domain-containing protein n=1 Tax=Plectus sambesii TaxID=2011161 RepID=A0A914W583_9BILA